MANRSLIRRRPSTIQLYVWFALVLVSVLAPLLANLTVVNQWLLLPPVCLGMVALVCLLDYWLSRRVPPVAIERKVSRKVSVGQILNIKIALLNRGVLPLTVELTDHFPGDWQLIKPLPAQRLLPNEVVESEYQVKPQRRGEAHIPGCEIRSRSLFGLWQFNWLRPYPTDIHIYPDFTAITDTSGLNGSINLSQAGLKKFSMRGNGMDFLQLRDYREGESIRQIDWRATSRFNRLISREFQEEKNQHVILMLDAGRRMCVQDDDLSYFDRALNALLMLSYQALHNGDNVSVQSFGEQTRWLGHVKGPKSVTQVLNHFYDLYPHPVASDYLSAAEDIQARQPKRALVLLVTCLRDEDFDDLLCSVRLLQKKHLVAVITIAEPIYQASMHNTVNNLEDALALASSQKLNQAIQTNIARLRQHGVICIHSDSKALTVNLINTYLSVKRAGLL